MSAKGVFITGTDTEVGKTVVAVQLMKELKLKGKKVIGYKPVASDAKKLEGKLINEDAANLIAASSEQLDYKVHNPYVYEPAVSPNIAAKQIKKPLSLTNIQENYKKLAALGDVLVVEGAGGWRSPLSDDYSAVDLVNYLNIPVILVVELKLGCINHALLTAEVMLNDNVKILGWVSNGPLRELKESSEVINTLVDKMPIQQIGKMENRDINHDGHDFRKVCQYF